MAIRTLYNKKTRKIRGYQVDYQDLKRGIPRTRQSFEKRKDAEEYEAALKTAAQDNLMGRRQRRVFGEALTAWLTDISPGKRNHQANLTHAAHLRYPIWAEGRRWLWLEHLPLEAPPGQPSIVPAMIDWKLDMAQVVRRSYRVGPAGERYYRRRTPKGEAWFAQAPATDTAPPPARTLVTHKGLIARLDESEGRGPYSPDTLRIRQAIVRSVLKYAWKREWITQDLRTKIDLEPQGDGRHQFLTLPQLDALVAAAKATEYGQHLADLIDGAATIGWRRKNMTHLTWDQVVWPERQGGVITQGGYLILDAEQAKNESTHIQPFGDYAETLLKRRWDLRCGPYVFHSGEGRPFGDFRKTWHRLLRDAGIPEDFVFHGLRHTFATQLLAAGASEHHVQQLGNWKSRKMVTHYGHTLRDHLRDTANLVRRGR